MNPTTLRPRPVTSWERGNDGQAHINAGALIAGVLAAYLLPVVSAIPKITGYVFSLRTRMMDSASIHPALHGLLHVAWTGSFTLYLFLPIPILALIILRWEHRPLSSAGWRLPSLQEIGPSFGAYVVIVWLDIALVHLPIEAIHAATIAMRAEIARELFQPLWTRITLTVWAVLVEECGRGYVIERFGSLLGSRLFGGVVALAGSMAMHTVGWGIHNVILVLPAQFILVILYLWRANVGTCAITHILGDGMSLVFWPLLSLGVRRALLVLRLA